MRYYKNTPIVAVEYQTVEGYEAEMNFKLEVYASYRKNAKRLRNGGLI